MDRHADDIREFISQLEAEGLLRRISKPVDTKIEISKITDAESKLPDGGKALLFENPVRDGKRTFPVATNLFGAQRRMSMALGVSTLEEAREKVAALTRIRQPRSAAEFFDTLKKVLPLARIAPHKKRLGTAPCQEVVHTGKDVDISQIPILKCWPHDAGRFVTLPLVFTKSLDGRERNLGMYRLQEFDGRTTGMHWHIHKDGAHFFHEYRKANRRMEVAVAIGADPATIYAATAPLPRGVDELLLAGFFRGRGVETVKCKTVDIEVPANAEFVLEGYVEPDELRLEGPFGDHTGYYSLADMYPVFHITALTHRRKPIYCATLVGPPPMEDCYMAKATERIFLPLLQTAFPEITDIFMPWEGVFHNVTVVAVDKEYPAHAQKVVSGLWGQGQMSFCKAIVAVDGGEPLGNLERIWDLLLKCDFKRDITIIRGVLDVLDHSAPNALTGAKIGIDLTSEFAGESARRKSEAKTECAKNLSTEEILETLGRSIDGVKAVRQYRGLLAVGIEKRGRGRDMLEKTSKIGEIAKHFKFTVFFDSSIDLSNKSALLWKTFNNVDPERDILFTEDAAYVDACKKIPADGHTREWPDDLSFDE